jgi:uncharacterized protein YoxC
MATTSTVSDLSARLKQKTEEDASLSRALILQEQGKLLSDLNRSYSEGLNTTLQGIQDALKSRLGQMALLTASEAQTLEKMVLDLQKKHSEAIENHLKDSKRAILKQVTPARDALAGMTEQVQTLSESMKKLSSEAQASTSTIKKNRLKNLLWIMFGCLIICGSGWGFSQYLSGQIQAQLVQMQKQKTIIDSLQAQGFEFMTNGSDRYLMFPSGTQPETGWVVEGKATVKY